MYYESCSRKMELKGGYLDFSHLTELNKRAKMALDRSPDFLRLLLPFFFFLLLSEKNLQEFLYVCTVQEASIH